MKRVLFVDDEVHVLSGLQRMLRSMRNEWDMGFAEGGEAALRMMAERPFDIVVSDMRMPGMNGAALLREVMRLYPATVRIVLSGHADKELVSSCVGVAHQYISKPCEAEQLKGLIRNACALSGDLVDSQVKRVIGSIDKLPTMPQLYLELKEALQDPDITPRELGAIIAQDMAMTVKVLKLVNSAFFGLRRTVENPAEAVAFLGIDTIQTLVIANGIFDKVPVLKTRLLTIDMLWHHSLKVAQGARALAELEGLSGAQQDESLIGGVLHDLGVLVLASNFPEAYDRVGDMVLQEQVAISTAEQWEFGVTHGEVGAYLLGLWGLPPTLLNIVSLHHHPERSGAALFGPLAAVHVSDALSGGRHVHVLFETAPLQSAWVLGMAPPERQAQWVARLEALETEETP